MLKAKTKADYKNIDDYLDHQTDEAKKALERIRKIVKETASGATEVISYGMPAFRYHGMLVYFAAFTHHCSLFPGSAEVLKRFDNELKDFKTSKGTIQFLPENPLPEVLITNIVRLRMEENESKQKQRKGKTSSRD